MSKQPTFTAEERLLLSVFRNDCDILGQDPETLFRAWVLQPTYRKAYLDYLLQQVPAFREDFEALYRLTPEPTPEALEAPLDWQVSDACLTALAEFRTRWKLPKLFGRELMATCYLRRFDKPLEREVYTFSYERMEACLSEMTKKLEAKVESFRAIPEIGEKCNLLETWERMLIVYRVVEQRGSNKENLPASLQTALSSIESSIDRKELKERLEQKVSQLQEQVRKLLLQQLASEPEAVWWLRLIDMWSRLPNLRAAWTPLYRKHARQLDPKYAERGAQQVYLRLFEKRTWEDIGDCCNVVPSTAQETTREFAQIIGIDPENLRFRSKSIHKRQKPKKKT